MDVRRHPGSRRMPHFARDALAERLPYLHLAELGGRRRPAPESPNGAWQNASFRGYADHMASEEFRSGLARLEQAASEHTCAVMCAEGLWWRCHRRLLADALLVCGWDVRHIAPDGRASAHELPDFAVVEDGALSYPPRQGELL